MTTSRWLAVAGLVAVAAGVGACGPATTEAGGSAPTTVSASGSPTASAAATTPTSDKVPAELSGTRQVTIVRVDGFEAGVTMTGDGRLAEVDDDSGRQLFVPTPLGGGAYLIKAYDRSNGHPSADEPSCWQVDVPGQTQPLRVKAAPCDSNDPDQRFVIGIAAGAGARAYTISNKSAVLRYAPKAGLILEEPGEGAPSSRFRLVDNGPARAAD
ncbi:hypothetical protein ACSNN7_01135 [Micromonospora sp. URMC 105]|uniref:hypothetical protein n=1 Tax=Micromonospora sp. URMC 105 TaxID=3423413 RepID=UPI003F1ABB4C